MNNLEINIPDFLKKEEGAESVNAININIPDFLKDGAESVNAININIPDFLKTEAEQTDGKEAESVEIKEEVQEAAESVGIGEEIPDEGMEAVGNKSAEFSEKTAALNAWKEKLTEKPKKKIVNAGLLKAGKSTLFNALAGKELFASDVVRATVENSSVELEKYILVDTPGLDAQEQDTKEAFAGYADADVLFFVHNMQEGELNQIEVDCMNQIGEMFGNREVFFRNTFLVMTHKDQLNVEPEEIGKRIEEQCKSVLKGQFANCFYVDSVGYLKGFEENKELLKKESGIPDLMEAIGSAAAGQFGLQEARFRMEKQELLAELEEAGKGLEAELAEKSGVVQKLQSEISALSGAKLEAQKIAEKAVREVRERRVSLPRASGYKSYGKAKDYKEYDSEYQAESAGKTAIEESISKIAQAAKRQALSVAEEAEAHIDMSKVPTNMVESLSASYERMRKCILEAGVTVQANFDVTLEKAAQNRELEHAREELRYVRDNARCIKNGFSSASSYATRYSGNLDIDYDDREKVVRNFAGNYRTKTVTVYKFDAQGAIDDISDDAVDKVVEICDQATEAISKAFREIKEDLAGRFESLAERIRGEIDERLKGLEEQEKRNEEEKAAVQRQLEDLSSYRNAVEGM